MNKRRLNTLINIMDRLDDKGAKIGMKTWQKLDGYFDKAKRTENSAHACGTVCCVAGWLAVTPEFKRAGGKVSPNGAPIFDYVEGPAAVARFLDIDIRLANGICGLKLNTRTYSYDFTGAFYGVRLNQITPAVVANRLRKLLETGV